MNHTFFLHRCLTLAAQGRGLVGNGAMVGAVLVRDDKILAEGWHKGYGKAHAERDLFENFTGKVLPTDTLYVNLEPCVAHSSKKNPPCADLLIERGVKHVVCGMLDPDVRVAGQGIALLRAKGVDVVASCLPEESARFNRGFVSVRTRGRPWITLKHAQTIDGDIANDDGSPRAITSDEQNRWSHEYLRGRHNAIVVGVGTILTDNPSLTIRQHPSTSTLLNSKFVQNSPLLYRIILDPNLRIPSQAKVLNDEHAAHTILIADPDVIRRDPAKLLPITAHGAQVFSVETNSQGNIILDDLWNVLCTPKEDYHGITSILLEGGQRTWDFFRAEGVVDEEVTLVGGV